MLSTTAVRLLRIVIAATYKMKNRIAQAASVSHSRRNDATGLADDVRVGLRLPLSPDRGRYDAKELRRVGAPYCRFKFVVSVLLSLRRTSAR